MLGWISHGSLGLLQLLSLRSLEGSWHRLTRQVWDANAFVHFTSSRHCEGSWSVCQGLRPSAFQWQHLTQNGTKIPTKAKTESKPFINAQSKPVGQVPSAAADRTPASGAGIPRPSYRQTDGGPFGICPVVQSVHTHNLPNEVLWEVSLLFE